MAFGLAALLAAGGVYLATLGRTSWSSYSEAQLDALEAEAVRAGARVDASFVSDERIRRIAAPGALVAGAVVFLVAFFVPARRRGPKEDSDEALRLAAAVGAGGALGPSAEQEQYASAARLLGVTLQASPAVIDAAYQAQLQERGSPHIPGRPDLTRLGEEHLVRLARARDLLIARRR